MRTSMMSAASAAIRWLDGENRKFWKRRFRYAGHFCDQRDELAVPFGRSGFEAMAERRPMSGIQKRFHLRPLGQIALSSRIAESRERPELRHERQFIFPVHIVQTARPAVLLKRGGKLLGLHVVRLDLMFLEQPRLGERLKGPDCRDECRIEGVMVFRAAFGVCQKITRKTGLDFVGVHHELFKKSKVALQLRHKTAEARRP